MLVDGKSLASFMTMERLMLVVVVLIFTITGASAECPHNDTSLSRWTDAATWGGSKPDTNENVIISGSDAILLDETYLDLGNITIETGGRLVFDPEVNINLRVSNIFISGSVEIGSEDCLHEGQVTITLKGTRAEHNNATHPKVMLVESGGKLEIHGQRRLSWTKIVNTIRPPASADVLFDHKTSAYESQDFRTKGLVVYTFDMTSGQPVVKDFGYYDLAWKGDNFATQLQNVSNGDIVMATTQRYIRLTNTTSSKEWAAFDAFETLVYGAVTYMSTLRELSAKGETFETFGFIFQKGNPSSYTEVNKPLGEGCKVQMIYDNKLVFTAETAGGPNYYYQQDNFIVQTVDSAFPKLTVIDDVSTWIPGVTVVLASTDYDWLQTEERVVIACDDCQNDEIRVDAPFKYTHYGEVLRGAVDMRAEVALLTRNIVIQGEMEDTCPAANENCDEKYVYGMDTFGAHVKILANYSSVHIEGSELRFVGQQTDLGRYPIHFHMCLDAPTANPPYIRENSIHNTFARCVTIHGSHGITVMDNFCYIHLGHGFYLEDGGEKDNVFDGNLAIGTKRAPGHLDPIDASIPASFWITNPYTILKNNVAGGGAGTGIWILFPPEPLGPSKGLGLMAVDEAKYTPITFMGNNVAHSNTKNGFQLASRLDENRMIQCCNRYRPKVNTTDPESEDIEYVVSHITSYKNRIFNVWISGGRLNVSHVSTSDSLNGIMLDNDGLLGKASGRVKNSVIIGNSENKGVPVLASDDRSFPTNYSRDSPQSGLTLWFGPTKADDIWFDGFVKHSEYDTGAIAIKRPSPYFQSEQTEVRGMVFAFDDETTGETGNINIAGVHGVNPGWEEGDAEHTPGYTFYHDLGSGLKKYYLVKGDHFSAAASDCKLRTNWRMAFCETKYGNVRLRLKEKGSNSGVVVVRDSLPSAQQQFSMEFDTGPQVVLTGSETYTLHFLDEMPRDVYMYGEGMETGDSLRFGICIPPGAEYYIATYSPHRATTTSAFTRVYSLVDLDDSTVGTDGMKYYLNDTIGMMYYKFVSLTTRGPDEIHSCANADCPVFRIVITGGSNTDADCRQRLYGDALNTALPSLPTFDDVINANGNSTPPQGLGAGLTRPFTNREVIDGQYGAWSDWSTCSASCAGGDQTRSRLCNNPMPANGGKQCEGSSTDTQTCNTHACPAVHGVFESWTTWTTCASTATTGCQGYHTRTRDCSTPKDGGSYCSGALSEMEACTTC